MSKTPTKVYPVRDRYLRDVPRVVFTTESKADAAALIATGAFTDNPNDPDRDHDVVDVEDLPRSEETGEVISPTFPVDIPIPETPPSEEEAVAPTQPPAPTTPPVEPAPTTPEG